MAPSLTRKYCHFPRNVFARVNTSGTGGHTYASINIFTRVDESLAALYGDIGKQAESLIGKAGSMATKFTGMTGAG
ncbi:TPA: hypothetical protein ACJFQD_001503 [Escherichia coli]